MSLRSRWRDLVAPDTCVVCTWIVPRGVLTCSASCEGERQRAADRAAGAVREPEPVER